MRETIVEFAFGGYQFLIPYLSLVFHVGFFVLLPLFFWRQTRPVAAGGFLVSSYVLGIVTWLLGTAVTFGSFGWLGLILGLLVFRIGFVLMGIIGAFFALGNNALGIDLLAMAVLTLVIRLVSLTEIESSYTTKVRVTPDSQKSSSILGFIAKIVRVIAILWFFSWAFVYLAGIVIVLYNFGFVGISTFTMFQDDYLSMPLFIQIPGLAIYLISFGLQRIADRRSKKTDHVSAS